MGLLEEDLVGMGMIWRVRSSVGPARSMQSGREVCIQGSRKGQVRPFSFWLKIAVEVLVLEARKRARAALMRMKGGMPCWLRSEERYGRLTEILGAK